MLLESISLAVVRGFADDLSPGLVCRLFAAVPAAKAIFPGNGDMSSDVFKAQMVRVASGMDLVINWMWIPDLTNTILDHMNKQHLALQNSVVTQSAMQVSAHRHRYVCSDIS